MAKRLGAEKPKAGSPFTTEVSDFLFATKSLDRLGKGTATWGDLANIGVTAASFVVYPAALGLLGAGALIRVIKAASKVADMDAVPVVVKRTAIKTLEDALTIKRRGYIPTANESIEPWVPAVRRTTEATGPLGGMSRRPLPVQVGNSIAEFRDNVDDYIPPFRATKTPGTASKRMTKEEIAAEEEMLSQIELSKAGRNVDDILLPRQRVRDQEIKEEMDLGKTRYATNAPPFELTEKLVDEIDDFYKKADKLSDVEFNTRRKNILLQLFPSKEGFQDDIPDTVRSTTELLKSAPAITNMKKKDVIRWLEKSEDSAQVFMAQEIKDLDLKTLKQEVTVDSITKNVNVREIPYETTKARSAIQPKIDELTYLKEYYEEMLSIGGKEFDGKLNVKLIDRLNKIKEQTITPEVIKRIELDIEELETLGDSAQVVEKLQLAVRGLKNRIAQNQDYIDNPNTPKALNQSKAMIPKLMKDGSYEYRSPRSYVAQRPGKVGSGEGSGEGSEVGIKVRGEDRAPAAPERNTLKELKSDEKTLLKQLEDLGSEEYYRLNNLLPNPKKRKPLEDRLASTRKEILNIETNMKASATSTKEKIKELEKKRDDLFVEYTNSTDEKQRRFFKTQGQIIVDRIEKLKNPSAKKTLPKKKPSKPRPSTTKVKEEKFNLEEAKKELEVLRQKYRELPAIKPGNRADNIRIIDKRKKLKQEGKILADRIKAVGIVETAPNVVIKNNSEVTFHSGMATGSDTVWAKAADAAGIKTIGHSFKGHGKGSRPALETRNELTEKQLEAADEFVEKAAMRMGEKYDPIIKTTGKQASDDAFRINLLRRNYYQIKDADAVIAITQLADKSRLKTVGGTRYAVQMGIDKGVPVYVFDQVKKSWFKWDGEVFVKSGLPPVYKSPATVGRRENELLPSGLDAIDDYMEQYVSRGTKAKVAKSTGSVVKWTDKTDKTVYIGRVPSDPTGRGKFGNPYEVGKAPDNFTVEEAVAKYDDYLKKRIKTDPDYANEIYTLKGKEIGCPGKEPVDQCHGTVILKAIKYLDENPKYLDDTPKAVKGTLSTSRPIDSFRGENKFLSNMSDSTFEVDGITYPTVEHFYQAMKTTNADERAKILAANTPAQAKSLGGKVKLRKDWAKIQTDVMMKALRAKFEQNPELKKKLIDTGDAKLIEGNNWGDKFWGQVNGVGQNWLGRYLMEIRKDLMKGN